MKSFGTLILVLTTAAPLLAADMVRVKAMFIEAGVDTIVTKAECDSDTIRTKRGVTVLGTQTALTRSGKPTRVSVDETRPALDADAAVSSSATNGLSLKVHPHVEGRHHQVYSHRHATTHRTGGDDNLRTGE